MYVLADLDRGGLSLEEPDDFGAFKLVARGSEDGAQLRAALGASGEFDGEGHAWLRLAALEELAGARAQDAGWSESFAGMVAYAGSKGWLSANGDAIRAHCEWRP